MGWRCDLSVSNDLSDGVLHITAVKEMVESWQCVDLSDRVSR